MAGMNGYAAAERAAALDLREALMAYWVARMCRGLGPARSAAFVLDVSAIQGERDTILNGVDDVIIASLERIEAGAPVRAEPAAGAAAAGAERARRGGR